MYVLRMGMSSPGVDVMNRRGPMGSPLRICVVSTTTSPCHGRQVDGIHWVRRVILVVMRDGRRRVSINMYAI